MAVRTLPRVWMYWVVHPFRPQDFPWPSRCPSWASGNLLVLGGCIFQNTSTVYNTIYPTSRQCTDTIGTGTIGLFIQPQTCNPAACVAQILFLHCLFILPHICGGCLALQAPWQYSLNNLSCNFIDLFIPSYICVSCLASQGPRQYSPRDNS